MNDSRGQWVARDDESIARLGAAVERRTGLSFQGHRRDDLIRAMDVLHDRHGDLEQICSVLENEATHPVVDDVVQLLTIGETSFFRNAAQFRALEEHVLPELIARRRIEGRYLRFWCAGCSTGEEPYSLAILLRRLIPDIDAWSISLLATDINEASLAKAKEGLYGDWSFRDVPEWIRTLYFEPEGRRWRVREEVRDLADLRYLNLVEDGYPSLLSNTNSIDVAFCRNVMIYFSPETIAEVVRRLWKSLTPSGWLVVGHADIGIERYADFETVALGDAFLYRRPAVDHAERVAPVTRVATLPDSPPARSLPRASRPAPSVHNGAVDAARDVPTPVRIHPVDRARADANAGRVEEALARLAAVPGTDARAAEAFYLAGVIHVNLGSLDTAADMLRRSLYLSADQPAPHYLAGVVSLRRGKVRAAVRHFRAAAAQLDVMEPGKALGDDGLTVARLHEIVRGELGTIENDHGGGAGGTSISN